MNSISLHNRWEIFQILEENDEDSISEIISSTDQEAKIITAAANEQSGGTRLVSKGRRRSKKICLLDTLPAEVTLQIMAKLGAMEIIPLLQQGVCSSWRNLAYDPSLYRCINLRYHTRSHQTNRLFKRAMMAVDLSKGRLDEFSIYDYPGKDLLNYVLDKSISDSIKILRFVKCPGLTDDMLLKFARKFSCLEELELSYCRISLDVIEQVGRICSKLTCFRLVEIRTHNFYCDNYPSVIVKSMPKLLRLQLGNFYVTAKELQAILDGLPYLVYLDLRHCRDTCIPQDEKKMFEERNQCLRLYKKTDGDQPEDYILNYCREVYDWCDGFNPCYCGDFHFHKSVFFEYDPFKECDADVCAVMEGEDVLENKVFLPVKATAYYL